MPHVEAGQDDRGERGVDRDTAAIALPGRAGRRFRGSSTWLVLNGQRLNGAKV